MKRFKILLTQLSILAGGAVFAQENVSMTIQEAAQKSMSTNAQIKISEAQLKTLESKVQEAKDKRLPDLNVTADLMKVFNTQTIKSSLPLGQLMAATGNTGGGLPKFVALTQLSASVPIFAGFKIKNGIAVAQYQKELKEYQTENQKQDVALQTVQTFINLYKAKQAISVIQENLERAHVRTLEFEKKEKNGIIARNDLMEVQLQESNVKLALAEAKKNINVLNYTLDVLTGLPENTNINPDLSESAEQISLSEEQLVDQSKNSREEYKILETQKKIGNTAVEIAKGNYYPTVALTAGYINAWMPDIIQATNLTNAGIALSYNLANIYKNKAAVETAKLQKIEIEESTKAIDDQLKITIHNAYQDYQLQSEKIKVNQEALAQANENYRVVKNKYDNGLATTTDLLTADVGQLQAKLNLVYSKADQQYSYYNLLRQTGKTKY